MFQDDALSWLFLDVLYFDVPWLCFNLAVKDLSLFRLFQIDALSWRFQDEALSRLFQDDAFSWLIQEDALSYLFHNVALSWLFQYNALSWAYQDDVFSWGFQDDALSWLFQDDADLPHPSTEPRSQRLCSPGGQTVRLSDCQTVRHISSFFFLFSFVIMKEKGFYS